MRNAALRFVWRGGLVAVALAIAVSLSLAAYCTFNTAAYISSSQQITGTVVDIEKPVYESQRKDFRPVVEARLPSGESFTGRFSGLYRVPGDSVGQPLALLYNSTTSPAVLPDSPLNWIGSIVYGSVALTLVVLFGVMWLCGRRISTVRVTTTAH